MEQKARSRQQQTPLGRSFKMGTIIFDMKFVDI